MSPRRGKVNVDCARTVRAYKCPPIRAHRPRRYADVPVGQIHADAGTGAPVLFLHQPPRSWNEFRYVLPLLGSTHRATAMDTPGFAESAPPRVAGRNSIESHAKGRRRPACGTCATIRLLRRLVRGESVTWSGDDRYGGRPMRVGGPGPISTSGLRHSIVAPGPVHRSPYGQATVLGNRAVGANAVRRSIGIHPDVPAEPPTFRLSEVATTLRPPRPTRSEGARRTPVVVAVCRRCRQGCRHPVRALSDLDGVGADADSDVHVPAECGGVSAEGLQFHGFDVTVLDLGDAGL